MSKTANLRINIADSGYFSREIPKEIELLDKSLAQVKTQWTTENMVEFRDLEAGNDYVARVILPSGESMNQVIDLEEKKTKDILFNVGNYSPQESQEWAYFNKAARISTVESRFRKTTPYILSGGIYTSPSIIQYSRGRWRRVKNIVLDGAAINETGETYSVQLGRALFALKIEGDKLPTRYVLLPPGDNTRILIKRALPPYSNTYPLNITVSTSNFNAEAILSIMVSGDIIRAKTLWHAVNAEMLLMEKMQDPAAAAIGGYFLLKNNELERMHNWSANLANWFRWMPDGAIIHAWFLIKQEPESKKKNAIVRKWLLEAVKRGIPIYTEGLKLLHDGLLLLSFQFGRRSLVHPALRKVRWQMSNSDLSQETTTISTLGDERNEGPPSLEKTTSFAASLRKNIVIR